MKLPRITARQAEAAILRDGWSLSRTAGSHRQYRHPTKPGRVTIAHHAGQILEPKTTRSIIRQARLTDARFIELL